MLICTSLASALIGSNTDVTKSTVSSLYEPEDRLEVVKNGRRLQEYDTASTSTRCLCISANDQRLNNAYPVLLASPDPDRQFLGRRVDSSTIDLCQLRRWLANCRDCHRLCKGAREPSATDHLYRNPSFRLIGSNVTGSQLLLLQGSPSLLSTHSIQQTPPVR